jgi:hypothetical protein
MKEAGMSVFLRRLAVSVGLAVVLTGAGAVATAAPAQAATFPPIGTVVCHIGPVSGPQCGAVTAVNVTIRHADGTLYRVFTYNACTFPGDRGASIFLPSTGAQIGTVFGSVGVCRTAGLPIS